MKLILVIATCLLCHVLTAQLSNTTYIYNHHNDTIHFSAMSSELFCNIDDVRITDTVQVNGKGSKEIVVFRHCTGFKSEHGGTFDIDESIAVSKYEVWDIDKKELLFEAVSSYESVYNRFLAYTEPRHIKGQKKYRYQLKIDNEGAITISNTTSFGEAYKVVWQTVEVNGKTESVAEEIPHPIHVAPDKQEGVYRFINGVYIRE